MADLPLADRLSLWEKGVTYGMVYSWFEMNEKQLAEELTEIVVFKNEAMHVLSSLHYPAKRTKQRAGNDQVLKPTESQVLCYEICICYSISS